jgi:hypothetical protein
MRLFLFVLTVLFLCPSVLIADEYSDNVSPTLVVWHKNGETTRIDLSSFNPVTTFDSGQITISKGFGYKGRYSGSFSISDILRYTYENVNNDVNGINETAKNGELLLKWQKDGMTLLNLDEGTQVKVFSADGTMLQMLTAHKGAPLTVTLSGYPDGVYVIKTAGRTFKLLKQ